MLRPGIRRLFRLAPWRRGAIEAELAEELRFHLEWRAAQFRETGLPPDAAWKEAVARFGTLDDAVQKLKHTAHRREAGMRISDVIDAVAQDTRYVIRQLARAPGFTAAVVITLALGIGANATMFGVLDRLLLRAPSGVVRPEQLRQLELTVTRPVDGYTNTSFAYADYTNMRDSIPSLRFATYADAQSMALGRGASAEKISGQLVGGPFFELLGTRPRLGRFFTRDDVAEPTGQPVAVIAYGFWQRDFGGRTDVLGKTLAIGTHAFTVVGVAPRYFVGVDAAPVDVWLPLTSADGLRFDKTANWMTAHMSFWLSILARSQGDSSALIAASRRATNVMRESQATDSTGTAAFTPVLRRYTQRNSPDVKVARLLLWVSGFVLLIACANVANLLLARAVRRKQEMAVRLALGIDSFRLTLLLFCESATLALLGGAAALVVVRVGGSIVRARFLANTTAWPTSLVDLRTLVFTSVATLGVMLVIGLAPLAQARRIDLASALKSSTRGGGSRRARLHGVLIVAQVALCVVLLVGMALFVDSLRKVSELRLGMDTRQLLVARMNLSSVGRSDADVAAAYIEFARQVRALPGVQSASVAMSLPFNTAFAGAFKVPGLAKRPQVRDGGPYYNAVDDAYFSTLGTRIIAGRSIDAQDRATKARVVVVNQSMAQFYWPGKNAVGQCVKVGGDTMPCSTVIGISENARRQSLIEGLSLQWFVSLERSPGSLRDRVLFVRTKGDPATMIEAVRRAMQTAAPDLPYADVKTMQSMLDYAFKPWTLGSAMFTIFGLIGLALAVVGLYGTLSYDVAQRSRELSVRIALGAESREIVRLVIGGGLGLVALGVVIGWVAAIGGSRWVSDLLYGVSPRDAGIYGGVGAVLLVVATLATALPAWRATRLDPREAMAAE